MQYHSSSSAYEGSYVKQTVDAWKTAQDPAASEERLITFDELKNNLGYELIDNGSAQLWSPTELTPNWTYNSNYWYWTMSQYNDSSTEVWYVHNDGSLACWRINVLTNNGNVVRPVIVLSKSVL